MAHRKSILLLSLFLSLGVIQIQIFAMEANNHQELSEQDKRIEAVLNQWKKVKKETEENILPYAEKYLNELDAQDTTQETISLVPNPLFVPNDSEKLVRLPRARSPQTNFMPGLIEQLDAYFATEDIDTNLLGEETSITITKEMELPASPRPDTPAPFITATAEITQEEVKIEQPIRPAAPVPTQKIDESFLAEVLKNIADAKAPMITASTLGLVHYLCENQIFHQAIGVRSPQMNKYLHKYILPTAREALAADLIQLGLPYLPYLNTQGVHSYNSTTYLTSYVLTKILGSTTLYIAKLATETEQGKKLVTQYKRLPKKTKETIAKLAPWIDFIRNMFMARTIASYIE